MKAKMRLELGALSALAAIVPSLDFPRPSNTDGTDSVRPSDRD